jgi:tripartite-type tricarboxylate transporter receptor subunit TctC
MALAFNAAPAADTYPSRPLRVIVSYPPAGATDVIARTVAQKLSEAWGQPVIVDNRPGASGNIGAEYAAKATPDGYTIFVNTSSHAIGSSLYRKLTYDLQRDFTGVSLLATTPSVLVANNALPVKDVRELVAYAKANPGKLSFGSAGMGSNAHLSVELFSSMTGTRFVHIPYKGNTGILADLIGGQIGFTIDSLPPYLPMVKVGKIRALAVSTPKRSGAVPDLPTIAEAGVPGYEATGWFGLSVPSATPRDIVRKLSATTVRILQMPDVHARLSGLGAEPQGTTPEQFDSHVKREIAKFAKVIRDAKVELQ